MLNDNILLITDDDDIARNVLSKLILLRETDSIAVSDYNSIKTELANSSANVVIVHEREDKDKTLKFIESIVSDNYEIILLVNDYNQEFILSAYDMGIKDYFSVNSEAYEMLIRTVNCFKYQSLKTLYNRGRFVLSALNAIDSNTNFFKYKECKELLKEFINNAKFSNGMFVLVTLDTESKAKLPFEKLPVAIKTSVRSEDIVIVDRGNKYYLLLPNIDKIGAFSVVDKVQKVIGDKYHIRAGVCKIADKSFEKLEKEAFAAVSEATHSDSTAVYWEDKSNVDDWLTTDQEDSANYKLFKNYYNNKLEKVIAPVFFRLQKAYESKLFHTKIEQYSDELQSVFYLKNKNHESRLKIIYPGFAKIVIYIEHEGLDSPENKEISLNLNEVTVTSLSKIVEKFIKEFKSNSES